MKKTIFAMMLFGVVALPLSSHAAYIDYAHLDYGASIYDYSSGLDDFQAIVPADPRDVIGGSFSAYHSGETGNFIFDIGDMDQYIIVDLGAVRTIDRVGGSWSPYPFDREVWDYFGVSLALDPSDFALVGSVGAKNDGVVDVFTSPTYFDLDTAIAARYVLYEFGQSSYDWGGGSRVLDVYAMETVPVPEPAAILLFAGGLAGLVASRKSRS